MKKIFVLLLLSLFMIGFSCKNEKQESKINYEINSDSLFFDSIGHVGNVESIEIVSLEKFKSRDLYVKNCKFCHGNYGQGDGIKARLDTTLCPYDLSNETKSDQFVYYVILNGKNKMPDHKDMNSDNSKILVIYIKRFRDKK